MMITPREIIRGYVSLLNILRQNPDANFESVVGQAKENLKPDTVKDPDALEDFEL